MKCTTYKSNYLWIQCNEYKRIIQQIIRNAEKEYLTTIHKNYECYCQIFEKKIHDMSLMKGMHLQFFIQY